MAPSSAAPLCCSAGGRSVQWMCSDVMQAQVICKGPHIYVRYISSPGSEVCHAAVAVACILSKKERPQHPVLPSILNLQVCDISE